MQGGKSYSRESTMPTSARVKEPFVSNNRSASNSPEHPLSYTQTQATDQQNGTAKDSRCENRSHRINESPLDLNLNMLRQSLRCSIDPDLNPIAEEIYPQARTATQKLNRRPLLSQVNLKQSQNYGPSPGGNGSNLRKRSIMSARNGGRKRNLLFEQQQFAVPLKEAGSTSKTSMRLKSASRYCNAYRINKPSENRSSYAAQQQQQPSIWHNYRLAKNLQSSLMTGPRRRAQTACNDTAILAEADLRLNRNRTLAHKFRALANNTTEQKESNFNLNKKVQSVVRLDTEEHEQKELAANYFTVGSNENLEGGANGPPRAGLNLSQLDLDTHQDNYLSAQKSLVKANKRHHPEEILKENKKLVMKSALNLVGQPVISGDI